MPSCEADDIEFAMLKPPPDHDEESASLPPEFEKPSRHRGCSKKTSIMVGMVAVLLTYFAGCSVAYQFGYHGTGFLLEAWLLAVPVSHIGSGRSRTLFYLTYITPIRASLS
jgi:hypothetical protein